MTAGLILDVPAECLLFNGFAIVIFHRFLRHQLTVRIRAYATDKNLAGANIDKKQLKSY
jgi:hypothetical protein